MFLVITSAMTLPLVLLETVLRVHHTLLSVQSTEYIIIIIIIIIIQLLTDALQVLCSGAVLLLFRLPSVIIHQVVKYSAI